jgi:conjugative relaxase-like TrwC/TraI family protein
VRLLRTLTISKALSAIQSRTYHACEFTSGKQNYWSRDQQGHSEWQGRLAHEWGLHGAVRDEHFARLSEGQHPESASQLVKHQSARTYENQYGKQITSAQHRAGWDATFSAPKSVSLTALVGGDERVREAHRESVRVAMQELEHYTQARTGNIHAPENDWKVYRRHIRTRYSSPCRWLCCTAATHACSDRQYDGA